MDDVSTGQITRSAAEVYEEFFVPALFQEWAPRVAEAAQIVAGHRVIDVACGTGVLAREASRRAALGGSVVGLDRNEGMLAVARRAAPGIDWRAGLAESLPFAESTFDRVVSQFGLMFFEDRAAALKEMWRVLRPGGRMAVAVCDALEHSPGYADMVTLLHELFGAPMADELRAPFVLGDPQTLRSLWAQAGIPGPEIATPDGTARFPSLESWLHTEIKGWTLADRIDDAQYRTLQQVARTALQRYVDGDGKVSFAFPAHIVSARKS
jgi:ubiquinone/menaquinone biosynthesis C-methylase UbiE